MMTDKKVRGSRLKPFIKAPLLRILLRYHFENNSFIKRPFFTKRELQWGLSKWALRNDSGLNFILRKLFNKGVYHKPCEHWGKGSSTCNLLHKPYLVKWFTKGGRLPTKFNIVYISCLEWPNQKFNSQTESL